ncbi:MAG: NADH-quinone oxidoreductase subunit N, partial [Pseudonocardia sp.]|nr:NADH-quinone oxidoreductase subunit N [Pseudonocardia sp.]
MSVLAQGIEVPPIDYAAIAPLLIILGTACVGVLVEAFLPRHQRWPAQVALSIVGIAAAGLTLGLYAGSVGPEGVVTLASALAVDRPTLFLWG